jgi:hypothetical protein
MQTIGHQLKTAREKKKVSLSQAALKTRVKVQLLEAMERDDFSRMPAPIYARGFIKTYCEFLGLNPAPLLQEYTERHGGSQKRPSLPEDVSLIKPAPTDEPMPMAAGSGTMPAAQGKQRREVSAEITPSAFARLVQPRALAVAGALVAVILLIIAAAKFWPVTPPEKEGGDARVVEVQRPVARSTLAVHREPPEPYIETAAAPRGTP